VLFKNIPTPPTADGVAAATVSAAGPPIAAAMLSPEKSPSAREAIISREASGYDRMDAPQASRAVSRAQGEYPSSPQTAASAIAGTAELPSCYARWAAGYFTILPEDNKRVDAWDVIVILALCFTALVLPFEVSLLDLIPPRLYIMDKCVDAIFSVDMILNFNMAFASNDHTGHACYEKTPCMIAKNYMSIPFTKGMTAGWFWPDLVTIIPFELLPAGVLAGADMRSVRLVRVLRLVRMLRLVRVVKLFKRWHTHVGFSFALVKLVRCVGVTMLLVHWLACSWAHIGCHPADYMDFEGSHVKSWISEISAGYHEKLSDLSTFEIYTMSVYFCTVVLTTVGFGDILPVNDIEVMWLICVMFLTGLTWAWVVANVVNVIQNADIFGVTFNQTMDDLNTLMQTRVVGKPLRFRIRKHLYESQNVHRHRHQLATTTWLSAGLQGELAIASGVGDVIGAVRYFRGLPPNIMTDLALHFKPDLFSPDEYIMDKQSLFVIRKGSCVKRGKLLGKGTVLGDDMILATDYLKDTVMPKTITFCEVNKLGMTGLVETCYKFPELDVRVRREQVRMAVRRSIVQYALKTDRRRKQFETQELERMKKEDPTFQGTELPKSTWDEFLATEKKTENDGDVKAELGWAQCMELSRKTGSHEEDIRELEGKVKAIRSAVDTANNKSRGAGQKLDRLRKIVVETEATTQARLETLEIRFDLFDRMAETIAGMGSSREDSRSRGRSSNGSGWWPASPKERTHIYINN